jgi:hypothetical protein
MREPIVESGRGTEIDRAETKRKARDGHEEQQGEFSRAHLPFGKRTNEAKMLSGSVTVMQMLMKRMANRKCGRSDQE